MYARYEGDVMYSGSIVNAQVVKFIFFASKMDFLGDSSPLEKIVM
jgi:hypothetical protein